MKKLHWLVVACSMLATAITAFAGLPQTISYQGYLTGTGGTPASGPVSMVFSLYSSNPARNNPVWRETQPSVALTNGIFSTRLGSVTPISAPFDVPYYLGVKVGTDAEMPIQPISSTGYAFRAATADALSGVKPVALPNNGLTVGTIQLVVNNGGVGINKSNPTAALDVSGNAAVSGSLSFGSITRQMLNLYGTSYGLGVQDYTLYSRTDVNGGFAWHKGGTHSNTANDPGPGGTALMTLDTSGNLNAGRFSGNGSGLTNINIPIYTFAGAIPSSLVASANGWAFTGPTVTITTTNGQRMTGAANAVLGTSLTTVVVFYYDLCYRQSGTTNGLTTFTGAFTSYGQTNNTRIGSSYAATSSVVPPAAGTWEVGFCVSSGRLGDLHANDTAKGWIMVTN